MATIRISDEAHQFRIDVEGRLAGEQVVEVRGKWQSVLGEASSRKFIIDISQLTGYDKSGSTLLREMYAHGACIAARNPRALVFLDEISAQGLTGPTLVYNSQNHTDSKKPVVNTFARTAAAGKFGTG